MTHLSGLAAKWRQEREQSLRKSKGWLSLFLCPSLLGKLAVTVLPLHLKEGMEAGGESAAAA